MRFLPMLPKELLSCAGSSVRSFPHAHPTFAFYHNSPRTCLLCLATFCASLMPCSPSAHFTFASVLFSHIIVSSSLTLVTARAFSLFHCSCAVRAAGASTAVQGGHARKGFRSPPLFCSHAPFPAPRIHHFTRTSLHALLQPIVSCCSTNSVLPRLCAPRPFVYSFVACPSCLYTYNNQDSNNSCHSTNTSGHYYSRSSTVGSCLVNSSGGTFGLRTQRNSPLVWHLTWETSSKFSGRCQKTAICTTAGRGGGRTSSTSKSKAVSRRRNLYNSNRTSSMSAQSSTASTRPSCFPSMSSPAAAAGIQARVVLPGATSVPTSSGSKIYMAPFQRSREAAPAAAAAAAFPSSPPAPCDPHASLLGSNSSGKVGYDAPGFASGNRRVDTPDSGGGQNGCGSAGAFPGTPFTSSYSRRPGNTPGMQGVAGGALGGGLCAGNAAPGKKAGAGILGEDAHGTNITRAFSSAGPSPVAAGGAAAGGAAAAAGAAAADVSALSSILFGNMGSPEFNAHILNEENILHFYGIRQAALRPVVREECKKEGGGEGGKTGGGSSSKSSRRGGGGGGQQQQQFHCVLCWQLSHRREHVGEGFGPSKKHAKRGAVKHLLAQLGLVTPLEYEQISRCMFSSLRARIQAKQLSFPGGPNEHRFFWTFTSNGQEVKIDAGGRGAKPADAEIAAMQDMYLKVIQYKGVQVEERERLNKEVSQMRQQQPSINAVPPSPQQSIYKHGIGIAGGAPAGRSSRHEALTKQDAGEINQQHHNLTARNQIKTNENVVPSAEGYRCTLEWKWLGRDGRARSIVHVGIGASKQQARAQAALHLMSLAGFLEPVQAADRHEARDIVNMVTDRQDPKAYVSRACALLERSNSATWRLFLPPVWRAALAENERSLVDALLDTLRKVTSPSAAAAEEGEKQIGAGEGGGQAAAAAAATSRAPQEIPPDVWEQLLDECTVLTNCDFGQAVLHELGELHLDQDYFPSPLARRYFQNFRLMLALEWQAQLAAGITDRRAYGDLFEGRHMVLQCKSAVLPIFSFNTVLKAEDREFLANVQFREDDIVLLRPYDEDVTESDSWRKCFVGVVTTAKSDNMYFNVNVRLASGEGAKHPDVLSCKRFKLYHLTPAVTHDRMVQALRSLTMHRLPVSQAASSYTFTSELRYLLLHTIEEKSKDVAARGPVPFLSDVDPALFDPLHRLNDAADGCTGHSSSRREEEGGLAALHSKKQRLGQQPFGAAASSSSSLSPLVSQVAAQARQQLGRPGSSSREDFVPEYDDINLPTDLPLTPPQRAACISALTNRLTLVQGPPGTGKTHVACAIIDAWQRQDRSKKILAVADSNVAADNLMEGLSERGIRSVRVGNGSESDLQEEAIADLSRYRDYMRLKQNGMFGEARTVRMTLFREAVRRHAVIIATCVGSGHEMFDEIVFSRVIIDEGAQSVEPSNLIPLAHGCRNFVLIGDHKQLPPTIISPEAAARGLDVSLLERFVSSGIAPIHLLDEQRRMHPSIAFFPSLQFYDGKVKSRDVDDCNRPPIGGLRWPSQHSRVCVVDISAGGLAGLEMSQGTSKYNTAEIDPILAIITSVANAGSVAPSQIGILTPYDAQKARLRRAINDSFGPPACYQIEVDSVDGFQGKEKDLIIFSAVRSNPRGDIGFLRDPRRMNVMLTRAKRGVIVVGDQITLWNDPINWRPWIQWVGSMRSIIPVTRLNDHLETPCYTLPSAAAVAAQRSAAQGGSSSGGSGVGMGGLSKQPQAFVPQGFQRDFAQAAAAADNSMLASAGARMPGGAGAAPAAGGGAAARGSSGSDRGKNKKQSPPVVACKERSAEEEEELEKEKEDIPEDWEQLL